MPNNKIQNERRLSCPIPHSISSSLENTTLSSSICLWEGGFDFHVHNMTVYMIFQFGALSIHAPLEGEEEAHSCPPQMSTLLNVLMSFFCPFFSYSPFLTFLLLRYETGVGGLAHWWSICLVCAMRGPGFNPHYHPHPYTQDIRLPKLFIKLSYFVLLLLLFTISFFSSSFWAIFSTLPFAD